MSTTQKSLSPEHHEPQGSHNDDSNDATPATDAAPTPAAPENSGDSGQSYEENPLDDAALREAAEALPVKDYSDYEIEIEAKSEYSDALFGSDDDLDAALDESQREKTEPSQAPAAAAQPEEPPKDTRPAEPVYDFSAFMAAASSADPDSPASGINHCPLPHCIEVEPLSEEQMQLVGDAQPQANEEPAPEPAAEEETAKPQSFAEKLKQKARQQFDKSKAHFDEYVGRSLPERELPLDFTFPIQKSKKDLDGVASAYTIRKLFEDKGKSDLSVFKQADQDLAKINRCQMMASSRHTLLDTYTEAFIPRTIELISGFERKPHLAGDAKRLAIAEHSDAALKHLILGYKQVYSGYYEAANVIYGPQRNSANAVLARLVELLLIEARLCVALHIDVPTSSIKAMNKLFTVARLYEPQTIAAPCTSMIDGETTSLKAMYFHFQVLLVFSLRNLSSQLYRVAHPYLQDKLGLLQLAEDGAELAADRQYWVLGHEHNSAPRLVTSVSVPEGGFAPTVIETTHFFNALKTDFLGCQQNAGNKGWKSPNKWLAAIKPHYGLTLLSALVQQLHAHEQSKLPARFSIYQPVRVRSFTGLEGIIAHLNFSYALATKKPAKKGEAVTDLPERQKPDKAQWRRAKEDGELVYMQLDEAETNALLDIGQLVLLLETAEDEEGEQSSDHKKPEQPTLGLVVALERVQGGKLNLTLHQLGHDVTHAALSTPSGNARSVLLAASDRGLLMITDHSLDTRNPIGSLTLPDGESRYLNEANSEWLTPKYVILREA